MKLKKVLCVMLAAALAIPAATFTTKEAKADNPIVQHIFAPDPAPMVYGDTVYMYTTHDEDETVGGFYTMLNWHCFSSKDMVNWTSHGQILSLDDLTWANDRAWAAQCIEKDGKFYFYFPVKATNSGICIGVAVSDSPTGPFVDAIGGPLIDEGDWNDIDPTVYIDDDGQAYLYFGNPELRYVKLNDDMISYDKSYGIKKCDMTTEAFGEGKDGKCSYAEGPWFYKRNNLYYMVYPAFGESGGENISYSTSESPTGPWTFGGVILEPNNCFTIHPGVVDYKDRSFLFYHGNTLDKTSSFHRSCAIEEITYNDDGSIPFIDQTAEGVTAVQNLNPYNTVEGETIAWQRGVEVERVDEKACHLYSINNENYVKVKSVDFGANGPIGVSAMVSGTEGMKGGTIEFRINCDEDIESIVSDEKDLFAEGFDIHNTDVNSGEVIATIDVKEADLKSDFVEVKGKIDKKITGVHDIFVVFKGDTDDALFLLDSWKFEEEIIATPTPAPQVTVAPSTLTPSPAPVITPEPVSSPAKVKQLKAKAGKKMMTLKWKKASKVKGYQVMYSTKKSFKKAVKKFTKKNTLKVKKLKKGTTYYVKVAAYTTDANGKKVFGKYSSVVKVKIKK